MKMLKALGCLVGLMLLLGACTTTWIDDQLGPVEANPGTGSPFAHALHKEYSWLARTFQHAGFRSEALFWNAKSARAAHGEEVPPENASTQGIPKGPMLDYALKSEARLKAQLAGDARVRDPNDLAIAQVAFDCFVRDWCPDIYKATLEMCKARFEEAMLRLEGAPPPPAPAVTPMAPPATDFWIYFDFDKYNIRPDAARVLDQVVESIRKMGNAHVIVTGHTDTVGSAGYNLILSRKRAASTATYLEHNGVPKSALTLIGKGKTDLRVPTPDNVRNQENRNVHIQIQ
jgi:OmpA-OmpF porin, OOP family